MPCPSCGSTDRDTFALPCKYAMDPWHIGFHSSHVVDGTGTYCFRCRVCACHTPDGLEEECPAAPLIVEVSVS